MFKESASRAGPIEAMTQMDPHKRGFRAGQRWAITWLHERAKSMNDPHARDVLNSAAFQMGVDAKIVYVVEAKDDGAETRTVTEEELLSAGVTISNDPSTATKP